jgi:hypothetical protein
MIFSPKPSVEPKTETKTGWLSQLHRSSIILSVSRRFRRSCSQSGWVERSMLLQLDLLQPFEHAMRSSANAFAIDAASQVVKS